MRNDTGQRKDNAPRVMLYGYPGEILKELRAPANSLISKKSQPKKRTNQEETVSHRYHATSIPLPESLTVVWVDPM